MARDDPPVESSSTTASLSSALPTSLDTVAQTHFECSVVVRDLERDSLSRRHDHVRCFIAHDDTASLNLYIDQRDGLDYVHHRLTNNIRHVYACRDHKVNVQLSSKKRLEVVLQTDDNKRRLFELLSKIETRELNHEHFPRVASKGAVAKIDPSTAFVTASDVWTEEVEMKTPPRLRKHPSDSSFLVDHEGKRIKARSSMSYRSHQQPPSSPPYDDIPAEWLSPNSPLQTGQELMTPMNSRTLDQAINQMPPISGSPPLTSKGTLLAKLSVYAPRTNKGSTSQQSQSARSLVARKSKVTYADSISSSRCADAVLQAILGLEVIKQELRHPHWLTAIDNQDCLFKSIVEVCSQRTRECIPLKTDKVKRHVTKRTSSSNPLNSQDEDAQVFLEELLNQSRQDILARVVNDYPFVGKFECEIDHRLVCMTCGQVKTHTEQNQILSLDLQERTRASKRKAATIQSLLPRFFSSQEISFYCDACDGEKAVAHRTVSRLPKVLVLHLKRFQRDERNHPWTNDEPVTLEDSLLLDQYCQAEALGSTLRYDEGLENIPTTPSDGFPSSDDSRYSSKSPTRSFHARTSTLSSQLSSASDHGSMSFDHDQYHAIHYVLDSDDEGFPREPSNIIDLVEDSDEELQYRWAIEDSIRVQSLSQSSISYEENEDSTRIGDETLTESIYEDIRALTSNDLSFMTDVQGTASLRKHGSALLEEQSLTDHQKRSGSSTPTMVPPKMILPELFAMDGDTATPKFDNKPSKVKDGGTDPRGDNGRSLAAHKKDDRKTDVDGRGGTQEKKDDDGDGSDSDDEDFKRAIQASLQPCSQSGVSEKEIKEQEDRDLEEAIRRSLLDREDNKENISPEDLDDKKKVKKEGVDGDGGGKQSSKRRDKHTAGADSSSNRLSFSQPVVGKRDLDLQSGGQRSGNALKRAQLRRSNTTDASTMLMSTRTRSGSSSSQAQQHASGSSSAPSSQSQSSSLQRSSSSHFEYNLRSLESRVAKKEQIQESPPLASKRWSTTKATRSATALTAPKKSDKSRPTGITSSTSSLSTPPTPTTPTTPKSAGGSYQASSSSSRSTASASRPPIISSGSSSTSSMPDKASHRQSGKHGDQAGPDGVAIQPPRGETERAGLYRLRAVVSKPSNTGSMGSSGNGQQAGYYLCDSLGSDGVWRCFDHQSVRRIGSWASMDQQRERIGYLAIYVHTV